MKKTKNKKGAGQEKKKDSIAELFKEKPILYLPKFSYFGDYQILYNLKSNIVFRTLAHSNEDKKNGTAEPMPDIIFMCISKTEL